MQYTAGCHLGPVAPPPADEDSLVFDQTRQQYYQMRRISAMYTQTFPMMSASVALFPSNTLLYLMKNGQFPGVFILPPTCHTNLPSTINLSFLVAGRFKPWIGDCAP